MNIQPINTTYKKPSFKSTFPVVHWVAETNGSYAPVAHLDIVKKLQGKIIRILNKPLIKSEKPMDLLHQRLRAYIGACDFDYRTLPVVRSFYNRTEPSPDRYHPIAYIISGGDVEKFENLFAKDIGRAKGNVHDEKTRAALRKYNRDGLGFVKRIPSQIKQGDESFGLHTKFEIVRDETGKIKDYRFIEARFLSMKDKYKSLGRM